MCNKYLKLMIPVEILCIKVHLFSEIIIIIVIIIATADL